MSRFRSTIPWLAAFALLCAGSTATPAAEDTATPAPLVATYESLADAILGAKQTEWNLVHSILATTYSHAEGVYKAAHAQMTAGSAARGQVEALAELVAQLGNEGDAAVAAVRKRLLEGGHHHHAGGEQQGIYDEGYVIVTRSAKKGFLDAATAIGKLASSTDAAALDAEWQKVKAQFEELHEGVEN